MEYNKTHLPFLDIMVISDEGKIETDIYLRRQLGSSIFYIHNAIQGTLKITFSTV